MSHDSWVFWDLDEFEIPEELNAAHVLETIRQIMLGVGLRGHASIKQYSKARFYNGLNENIEIDGKRSIYVPRIRYLPDHRERIYKHAKAKTKEKMTKLKLDKNKQARATR